MFVAASTRCFPDVTIDKSLQKLADLEFSSSEIVVGRKLCDLRPEWLKDDFNSVQRLCLLSRKITPSAFFLDLPISDPEYDATFELVLRLCRGLGVVVVVVRSAPTGVPFNEEYERLKKLAVLSSRFGVFVSVATERDSLTGTIDAVNSMCKGISDLRVSLDPSHFIYGHKPPINFDSLIPKTAHLRLRDTSFKEFQVKIGQGKLEYKKLVDQLNRIGYSRALCVDLAPLPDIDSESELRKMRLLMESLL